MYALYNMINIIYDYIIIQYIYMCLYYRIDGNNPYIYTHTVYIYHYSIPSTVF